MSDYFGSNQSRVLSTSDRSLDNVIFQHRVPPLSSEWNLINQISNTKVQETNKLSHPSGWLTVDDIQDLDTDSITEAKARSGQILTSVTYGANKFKLVSKYPELSSNVFGQYNAAIVNGWPIIFYNAYTSNLIELGAVEANNRYDFVFLEVWRKLISSSDPIYPFGCADATAFADNELVADFAVTETTKRVQLQYRIRVEQITSDVSNYFNLDEILKDIYPRGGRSDIYSYGSYKFRAFGSQDSGLYVSGSGESADQTILSTVDGYCYAIPMFLIYRRGIGEFGNSSTSIHKSNVYYGANNVSDRPDGKFLDVIYKDDIVDLRHKVVTSKDEISAILKKSFRKIITNDITSSLSKGYTDFNGSSGIFPGGNKILKRDQLNGTVSNIGDGVNTLDPYKKRRYCNASYKQSNQIINITPSLIGLTVWDDVAHDITSLLPASSEASLDSVLGLYTTRDIGHLKEHVDYEYDIDTNELTILNVSIIGTSVTVSMQLRILNATGNKGFFNVPKSFIEYNKESNTPYALNSNPIYLRKDTSDNSLVFTSSDVIGGVSIKFSDDDTTSLDCIRYGTNKYGGDPDFGMILSIHKEISSGTTVTIGLSDQKIYGYCVLGVKAVYVANAGSFELVDFTGVTRIDSSITITEVSITAPCLVKVDLYIGSKSESDTIKFFDVSKQARGIVDVYEMYEFTGKRIGATQSFLIDTGDKPILSIAGIKVVDGDSYKTEPYVYDSAGTMYKNLYIGSTTVTDFNMYLPCLLGVTDTSTFNTSLLPTNLIVRDGSSSIAGSTIKVPLFVHSYVISSEDPYNFYYIPNSYKGMIKSTDIITGKIESEGNSIITSEGSGAITNLFYNTGKAEFTLGSRQVNPVSGPLWGDSLNTNKEYYIRVVNSDIFYKVETISNDYITISSPYKGTSTGAAGVFYEIICLDESKSNISNIIDLMPTYSINDYYGECDLFEYNGYDTSILEAVSISKLQDPLDAKPFDFNVGPSLSTSRGMPNFLLTLSTNDSFNLSYPRPHVVYLETVDSNYKKVFQSYLFNKIDDDSTNGILYMMIIGSSPELGSSDKVVYLNSNSNKDIVDLFELYNRPIIK